jgi:hypothetical protein
MRRGLGMEKTQGRGGGSSGINKPRGRGNSTRGGRVKRR